MKKRLLRVIAFVACAIAVVLPVRARGGWASILGFLARVPHPRQSRLFRLQVRFWNNVVLGFVFYLGFPIVRLLAPLWGPSRLSPRAGAASYWCRRPPPDDYDRRISDPF